MSYTREQIEAAVKKEGHKWFENGDYNVNIIGVRNSETANKVTNRFDDIMTLAYKLNGQDKSILPVNFKAYVMETLTW